MPTVHLLPVLSDNYIFILRDDARELTCVIDPAEAEPVLTFLNERGWQPDYILNTHHHHDHVGGNIALKEATGCQIIGYEGDAERIPGIDKTVEDNEELILHGLAFRVIFVPGHTRGHIAYYCQEAGAVFVGDTLFAMGCGRLFEGTPKQMWHSLGRLTALPDETQIYCAHEYTKANGKFALHINPDDQAVQTRMEKIAQQNITIPTTIEKEKATNPFLKAQNAEHFSQLRQKKDHF